MKKTVRYYYWLTVEFFKKYLRLILISFFASFLIIVGILSVSPYIKVVIAPKEIIGLVGNYNFNNLPDEVVTKISNGLVIVNEKGEIIPLLANSWEVQDEGKRYRFHLNYQFADVQVKPIDDFTIDFILKKPLAIFPTYLNKPILRYPLVGIAGFYRVGKIKSKEGNVSEISLIPNTKNLNPIIYKFYVSDSQLVTAYKRGEINSMTVTKKSIADSFEGWKNSKITKTVDYTRLLTIFFNGNNNFLADKNIKEALSMLFDYVKLADNGEIAQSSIPPLSWAFNPNLKSNVYDVETSTGIIKNNTSATESATLNLVTYYDYYDIADTLVGDIEKSGLKVNLNVISQPPVNYDLFLAFLKIPTDPDQYYYWHSTQKEGNIANYRNVRIDKLLEDGRSTINIQDREKIYFDLQKNMKDDPPGVFLYYPYVYTIKRK